MKTDEELRDWYAGQALAGLLAKEYHWSFIYDMAWRIADEMMDERERRKDSGGRSETLAS